jgi:hypothetical protein
MNPKKHLQAVFILTSALLVIAVFIYLSGCKPPFLVGLCSAVRLTRVALVVLTTLNFLLVTTIAYELKIKKLKKSENTTLLATYLVLILISLALALLELKIMTQIRLSKSGGVYSYVTQNAQRLSS